ncbi:GntR family transcriptional regulator [Sodalis sp. RH24]|uniref:GntR family transcriptional regulator n=1 Tax=unclassified Sodalis (in: enterobacteria) TaxID=2636512 RepID=UPI0039B682C8
MSLPLGMQLRGLVEYAITFGALKPGDKLPSVRDMAERVGVAPMTVAQVYRELKQAELIYSKPGSGTFIADAAQVLRHSDKRLTDLHQHIDALIDRAQDLSLSAADLAALVTNRFHHRQRRARTKTVLVVGNFIESARDYAQIIAGTLGDGAQLDATTLSILTADNRAREQAHSADLILTFAHRRREVMSLLPGMRVINISFIPSEQTRRALASLDPLARVLVVSIFPEFTALMKTGVQRFAPHVQSITVVHRDDPELNRYLAHADVLVYATGAEALQDALSPGQQAFEYRHIPDSGDIRRVVMPLLTPDVPSVTGLKEIS